MTEIHYQQGSITTLFNGMLCTSLFNIHLISSSIGEISWAIVTRVLRPLFGPNVFDIVELI